MNKKILIFGGTSDIGFAIAKEFAVNHYDVVLIGRNTQILKENQLKLNSLSNSNISYHVHDFSNMTEIKYNIDDIISNSDLSLVCYGELTPQDKLLRSDASLTSSININLTSHILLINKISQIYKEFKGRSILVVSSVAGDRGKASNYIYGSTKSALSTYLSGLRQQSFKSNLHICTIKPGFISTKMTKHMKLPALLTSLPDTVGKQAFKAYIYKKDIIYVPGLWKYIMFVIKIIPELIFKRIKL